MTRSSLLILRVKNWPLPAVLLAVFAVVWLLLAIAPFDRGDWLLENLLSFVAVPLLILTCNRLRFSNAAYLCLFVFFCLHTVGSHYTYSQVPYDAWFGKVTGQSLDTLFGFERNQYDRAVHFLYGALMLLPSVELLAKYSPPRGLWKVVMPLCLLAAHSVIYELIEWLAALIVAPELGQAYLGTQGDPWDAQKDMALAALGSLIAMAMLWLTPRWQTVFKHAAR
jgi:putative membrane protein